MGQKYPLNPKKNMTLIIKRHFYLLLYLLNIINR